VPVTHVFASLPVVDRDAAAAWYERLLGRPADLVPNDDEAAWQLSEGGWIYVIVDPERAGSGMHTLLVDDLDAFLGGLAESGIAAAPVETIATAVRRTLIVDPDGNRLKVGQPLA
jgi:catechol 2,3-dioxygenase-like lactoylglutathione lyase family enzyme